MRRARSAWGNDVAGEGKAALALVDAVKGLEGGRGPDDEAAKVATRGELEEVEGVDGGRLDTRDVAETGDKVLAIDLRVVDDQRSTALAVAAATELTLTGTELPGVLDTLDVGASANSLEEAQSGGSLAVSTESLGVNDEGTSAMLEIWWPRAKTRGATEEAARAGGNGEAPER